MDEWFPVRGWEGLYEVTKTGRVKRLSRTITTSSGQTRRILEKEMCTSRPGSRYPGVMFCANGRKEDILLHRLLAQMFVPNPENLPVVRHLNDNPRDYRLDNLAWGTQYDNLHDIFDGRGHYNSLKTHCKRGHLFDDKNTYVTKTGGRICRNCRDEAVRKSRERLAGTEPRKHGTVGAYRWNGCRCEICKEFMKRYTRDRNSKLRGRKGGSSE